MDDDDDDIDDVDDEDGVDRCKMGRTGFDWAGDCDMLWCIVDDEFAP